MNALSEQEILVSLSALPGWEYAKDSICKTFVFNNFIQAMHFVNSVARLAEQQQHHPSVTILYNKVELSVNTHDAGDKVTNKDLQLASAIEAILNE